MEVIERVESIGRKTAATVAVIKFYNRAELLEADLNEDEEDSTNENLVEEILK